MKNHKINDEILDEALGKLMQGVSVDQIIEEYAEYADELKPLLENAYLLKNAPDPEGTDSANLALFRIITKLAEEEEEEKEILKKFTPPKMLMRIAAAIAVTFLLGWGTVQAASDSLPGDILYPIKLLTEKARFMLSINREDKVELKITFSEERLKELVKKYNSGKKIDKELLSQMLDNAQAALNDTNNIPDHIKPIYKERIATLSKVQISTLKKIEKTAPPEARKLIKHSINRCAEMMNACSCSSPQKCSKTMMNGCRM